MEATSSEPREGTDSRRARLLRACDRCRRRKVKCDNQDPCEQCAKVNLHCTFEVELKILASSDTAQKKRRRLHQPSSEPRATHPKSEMSKNAEEVRRSSAQAPPNPFTTRYNRTLDSVSSAHFYVDGQGTPRMQGFTSGFPLLDAARNMTRDTSTASPQNSTNHEWDAMTRLLLGEEIETQNPSWAMDNSEMDQFFPDRRPDKSGPALSDLFARITAVFPQDLLASLIKRFFEVIHPSWPIVHPAKFLTDLYAWNDPFCTALAVAMAMLASRYVADPRILDGPDFKLDGYGRYHELFRWFIDQRRGSKVYETIAYFFAAQYFCLHNVPDPLAGRYIAIAVAQCADLGLHRLVPKGVLMSEEEREMRKRIAWAIFCWDKQAAALFGRFSFVPFAAVDVGQPAAFTNSGQYSEISAMTLDPSYVEVFQAFISVSVLLSHALTRVSGHCSHPYWPVVEKIASMFEVGPDEEEELRGIESRLSEWRQHAPLCLQEGNNSSTTQRRDLAVACEQALGCETMIEILVHTRRLFMTIIDRSESMPKGSRVLRTPIIEKARSIISSGIRMGSSGLLGTCDAFFVYRISAAARLLIACYLIAQGERAVDQAEQCSQSVRAASMLLNKFASIQPIALGAAETLVETCRIHKISVVQAPQITARTMPHSMWYRPLAIPDGQLQRGISSVSKSGIPTSPGRDHRIFDVPTEGPSGIGITVPDELQNPPGYSSSDDLTETLNDPTALITWLYNQNSSRQMWSLPDTSMDVMMPSGSLESHQAAINLGTEHLDMSTSPVHEDEGENNKSEDLSWLLDTIP